MKHKIFIGWDSRQTVAFDVCKHSLLRRSAHKSLDIFQLELLAVKHILKRPTEIINNQMWDTISGAPMSTEFAISRFCVPFLAYTGWALFMDSDMVCLSDISELFGLADKKYAVMCVKHSQEAGPDTKMEGQIQTYYQRKNWSSLCLWNLDHPANRRLTIDNLNSWPGRDLHAFKWLEDSEIGELPQVWNFLVGVNEGVLEEQKMLHYTNGQPGIIGWERQPTDKLWLREQESLRQKYYGALI